jgi:hypothetical protein
LAFDGLNKGMNATTPPDFWVHYEIVSGKAVSEEKQKDFFRCEC